MGANEDATDRSIKVPPVARSRRAFVARVRCDASTYSSSWLGNRVPPDPVSRFASRRATRTMASSSRRARSPAATSALTVTSERPRPHRPVPAPSLMPAELVLMTLAALCDDDGTGTADARCAAARDFVDDLLECSVVCRRFREPAQALLSRILVLGKPEPFARGNGWSPALEDRFMEANGTHCKPAVHLLRAIYTHTNLSPFEASLLDNLGVFLAIDEVVGWAPGTADSRGIKHAHLRDADVTSLDLPVLETLRLDAWDQPPDDTPPLAVPRSLESIRSFRIDLNSLVPAPDHAMTLVGRLCAMSSTLRRLRIDNITLPAGPSATGCRS